MSTKKSLNRFYSLLALITVLFLVAFIWFKMGYQYEVKDGIPAAGIYPGEGFKLSESELKANKTLAEKGDVKAMHNLWLYYGVYMGTEETLKDFEYWSRKITEAAKAGDLEARSILPDWEKSETVVD